MALFKFDFLLKLCYNIIRKKGGFKMLVTCIHCHEKFEKEEVDYVRVGTRYAHRNCHQKNEEKKAAKAEKTEKKAPKKNLKVCFYCGKTLDIANEPYGMARVNRYAHKECYDKHHVPDDDFVDRIYEYLKQMNINYDYQACERLRLNYQKKLGYTNEGMFLSLKYFYGVKKMSADKSKGRIGIIPYVYDEAIAYFANLKANQSRMQAEVNSQKHKKVTIHVVAAEKVNKNKNYIDLSKIVGD